MNQTFTDDVMNRVLPGLLQFNCHVLTMFRPDVASRITGFEMFDAFTKQINIFFLY